MSDKSTVCERERGCGRHTLLPKRDVVFSTQVVTGGPKRGVQELCVISWLLLHLW